MTLALRRLDDPSFEVVPSRLAPTQTTTWAADAVVARGDVPPSGPETDGQPGRSRGGDLGADLLTRGAFHRIEATHLTDRRGERDEARALAATLGAVAVAKKVIQAIPEIPREARSMIDSMRSPVSLADLVASNLDAPAESAALLEELDVPERLCARLLVLCRQLESVQMRLSKFRVTQIMQTNGIVGQSARGARCFPTASVTTVARASHGSSENDRGPRAGADEHRHPPTYGERSSATGMPITRGMVALTTTRAPHHACAVTKAVQRARSRGSGCAAAAP